MLYEPIFLLILAAWLLALTFVFFYIYKRFNSLIKGVSGKTLNKILNDIFDLEKKNKKRIDGLINETKEIREQGTLHIQKVGLVRFNPFSETGGDHSFSAAFLDGKDTGVVLTGLHTRERTRLYLKSIIKSKSEQKLSDEERMAIEKAQKKN